MDPKSFQQIAAMVGGKLHGMATGQVTGVGTDSRSIRPGDLFVALRGDVFDGHFFLSAAKLSGAAGALVSEVASQLNGFAQIKVPDTLAALQRLAQVYRKELSLTAVGVTGSSGKTSTKEMIASVLAELYAVVRTIGNFNNHIGLPLTVLSAGSADDVGVFEMGMNHAGELLPLCEIAQPNAAVITNIGAAHIGHLGTREAIAAEKAVVAESVPADGFVVLNANDDFTDWIAGRCKARVVRAGLNRGDVRAQDISQGLDGTRFTLYAGAHRAHVQLPIHGEHMVANACLAAAVGIELGLNLEQCAAGLAKSSIPGNRLRLKRIGRVIVINDAYNANPDSMVAALKTASQVGGKRRRIAALGRMAELGRESEAAHRRVGQAVAEFRFDHLVTVGDEARLIAEAASSAGLTSATQAETHEQAVEDLLSYLKPEDVLLVKGSFASAMDRVVTGLEASMEPLKGSSL
ncbi:MAG TPA: UDP-N-acetylmuramoyl-tripeptide--D-alanyl-D-alanine ligase [Chthoniobacterales bacterium]|nr:UDP-N-acetylmuramoyl-tripeptide--D-alanyl-D-alanine ligase [Chthoniobacterales bacterium]